MYQASPPHTTFHHPQFPQSLDTYHSLPVPSSFAPPAHQSRFQWYSWQLRLTSILPCSQSVDGTSPALKTLRSRLPATHSTTSVAPWAVVRSLQTTSLLDIYISWCAWTFPCLVARLLYRDGEAGMSSLPTFSTPTGARNAHTGMLAGFRCNR